LDFHPSSLVGIRAWYSPSDLPIPPEAMRVAFPVSIVLVLVGPNGALPIQLVLHWPRPSIGYRRVESSEINLAVEILQGHKQRVAAFDENRDGRGLLLVLLRELAQTQPSGCGGSLRSFSSLVTSNTTKSNFLPPILLHQLHHRLLQSSTSFLTLLWSGFRSIATMPARDRCPVTLIGENFHLIKLTG
jgi:hypothetical protein